jgi:hypothetical protein
MRGEIYCSFLTLKFGAKFGLPSLRRPAALYPVLAVLAVFALSSVSAAQAQSNGWSATGWVSNVSIQDLTGNSNIPSGQSLLAGHSYNLTLQVNVPNTSTSTPNFDVSLNSLLQPSGAGQSVYWVVHNPSYQGYDRAIFSGGKSTVEFNYTQGNVKLSAYFEVPTNFTRPVGKYSTPSGNGSITLHIPEQSVTLVSVVPVGSTGTGSFSAAVEDQDIQTFLNTYNQTSDLVPSGKISSSYSTLITSLLGEAKALDNLGLPGNGTALLDDIVPSAFPAPPSSSLQTYLLGGLVVAIILVVLLAVLNVRSRGKSGYSVGIINDVQKELAVLEVTAAKYDRGMADKLKSLRDKLSESS